MLLTPLWLHTAIIPETFALQGFANMKKILLTFIKKILLTFFAILILLLVLYYNDTVYGKLTEKLHIYIVHKIDNAANEIDLVRLIKQSNLAADDYVDLILSGDDLKHLTKQMTTFLNNGFVDDRLRIWRKAKVVINGENQKVKYKIHGTNSGFMRLGLSPWDMVKAVLSSKSLRSIPPLISSGAYSLKIKHKKDTDYRDLMRRYTLISRYDDPELSTIAVNKIAANLGLIAPHGKMVVLRINGAEIGAYMLIESHGKEWFERQHQLTNYTIFKSNDDWNRKNEIPHLADTDLYMQNKEVKTTSLNYADALGAMEFLLDAVRNKDIERVKKVIDMDYMAKYMALLSITNNSHPIAGDNLRYIYDHSTAKFKLLFRLESNIFPNNQTIVKFNISLFDMNEETKYSETFKLFKLLLTDTDFLTKRDRELYDIIQNNQKWQSLAQQVFNQNMDVAFASKMPIRPVKYKINQFNKNWQINIAKAKKYLDYNKVFVSKYTDLNGNQSLSVLNDFNHPILLKTISRKSDTGEISEQSVNIAIKPLKLNIDLSPIYTEQKIYIDTNNIYKLSFVNVITGQEIEQKHIYINQATEFPYFSQSQALATLDNNNIDYAIDVKAQTIKIKQGIYNIKTNIIIADGFKLNIASGTTLLLGEGVSFLSRGSVSMQGTNDLPIKIARLNADKPFGTFAIMGNGVNNSTVNINHLIVDGGSQALVNGISFTGQMSIHQADVTIDNSIFMNSLSDDGINIKYSKVNIKHSKFINNFGDQIDLDFCDAVVTNNIFLYEKSKILNSVSTDGLDISGTTAKVQHNSFKNFSDKGISIGEKSTVLINNNNFEKNTLAIAVKDASQAFIGENTFNLNALDLSQYIKKKFYAVPTTYTINDNKRLNYQIENGSIFYLKETELANSFETSIKTSVAAQ